MKKRNLKTRKKINFIFVTILILLFGICLYELFVPISLPKPKGTYAVGLKEIIINDTTRKDPNFKSGFRNLIISIYYPSLSSNLNHYKYTYPLDNKGFKENFADIFQVPKVLGTKYFYTKSNSLEGIPIIPDSNIPTILFSHGYSGMRMQSLILVEELVSQGFAVVCIEHTGYSLGAVFPEGLNYKLNYVDLNNEPQLANKAIQTISDDQIFVKNKLHELKETYPDSIFGKLSIEQPGILGHSVGGAASFFTISRDSSFNSAANLDGFYFGEEYYMGTKKPLLEIRSDVLSSDSVDEKFLSNAKMTRKQYQRIMFDDWEKRLNIYAQADLYRYKISGTNHFSFTDLLYILPFRKIFMKDLDDQINKTVHLLILFFDNNLKGNAIQELEPSKNLSQVVI